MTKREDEVIHFRPQGRDTRTCISDESIFTQNSTTEYGNKLESRFSVLLPRQVDLHRRNRDREVKGDQHKGEEREEDLVREEVTRSNVCTLRSDLTVLLALYSAQWGTCLFPVLGMVPVRD